MISEATEFIRNLGNLSPKEDLEVEKFEKDLQVYVKQEEMATDIPSHLGGSGMPENAENTGKVENIERERKVHFEEMEVYVKEEDVNEEVFEDEVKEEAAFHSEPLVSSGLGATLALLSQKGLVQRLSPEEQERANKLRERELWLVEQRKKEKLRIAEREKEREKQRASGHKLSGRDLERQREIDAKRLEREQIRLKEEKFKNYVPDVKIAYYDEFGRELNTKEVF